MVHSTPKERKLRADALRNRERILTEAKAAFARAGHDVSLEDIGRLANVGVGTMSRHFSTHDALLEGVYRAEVERLAGKAQQLANVCLYLKRCDPG